MPLPRAPLYCLAFILLVAGCGQAPPSPAPCDDPLGCVDLLPGEPVTIGVLQALTGEVATIGRDQIRGLELALAQRHGHVAGRQVRLIEEDTGCTAEGGANGVLRFLADPAVAAIFGTTCSAAAAEASEAMSAAGLTMISGNNSAPYLTSVAGGPAPHYHPGFFRTAPNEEAAGQAAARFAFQRLGRHRAALVNDGDIYTRGLTEGFKLRFERLGGTVVLDTAVAKGEDDMAPVLEAVRLADADILFFPLFQPEGNRLLLQARAEAGLDDVVLMSDGALIEQSFIDAVGGAARGLYFVGPYLPDTDLAASVRQRYLDRYHEEPATYYYLSAYDAGILLLDALEAASVSLDDGTLRLGRQRLRDVLHQVRDVAGATGTLSCDRFGDCLEAGFAILRLDDPAGGVEGLRRNRLATYGPGNP